jgi:hypothetical protein
MPSSEMWRRVGILLTDVDYSYLLTLVHRSWISYTLKMEAIRSSESSVNKISTRRYIPEHGILHSHRSENLKSYFAFNCLYLIILQFRLFYATRT